MQLFRVSVEYSNFKTDLHSDLEVASSTASSRNRHKHLVLLFYLNKVCSLCLIRVLEGDVLLSSAENFGIW